MDQRILTSHTYFRLTITNLILRLPVKPSTGSSSSTCHQSVLCKVFFKNHSFTVPNLPVFLSNTQQPASLLAKPTATIDLPANEMTQLIKSKKPACVTFKLYAGLTADRMLGTVKLPVDFCPVRHDRGARLYSGWLDLNKRAKKETRLGSSCPQLHVSVFTEPDQRLCLEFSRKPKGNTNIYHTYDPNMQPVFASTFTWGPGIALSPAEPGKPTKGINGWLRHQICSNEKRVELRSGWSVTISNRAGSPVAVASMVVPYVPEMQPQAWLVERLVGGDWAAWGRLAAWHVQPDPCVYIWFEREEPGDRAVEWLVNPSQGGTVCIDCKGNKKAGFVFLSDVIGDGNRARITVEISVKHIGCVEDAAAFLALAAAVNLSVDACRPFI